MDKGYYIEYFKLEREHWWFRARKKIISSHIESFCGNSKFTILNIGAATGASSEMLSAFGDVTSLEFDKDCCEFVKQQTGQELICASITELPFEDESFDIVCAFDVVEHVSDHQKAMLEMTRVCRKSGMVFCTVPAFMFLWSHHDVVNHHERRYTLKKLKSIIPNNGKVMFASYFNTLLFLPISVFRIFDKIFKPKFVRHDAGSDFSVIKNSMIDRLFYRVMLADNFFIQRKISLPFGVSILLSFSKKD
jgi:2-polyprenyl-3-methyl-5-hydroxy-6-metoxy-1,4-benzoquinol methylase